MFTLSEKTCEICGKSFIPANIRQKYCKNAHYRICPICGKSYEERNLDKFKSPPTTCSIECRVKKRAETSIRKYGITAPGNNPEAREKSKQTMKLKYGVEYAQESKVIRQKSVESWKKKYGTDNPQKAEEVRNKTKMTKIMRKYNYKAPQTATTQYIKNKYLHSEFGVDIPQNAIDNNAEFFGHIKRRMDELKARPLQTMIKVMPYYFDYKSERISSANRYVASKLNESHLNTRFEFTIDRNFYDIRIEDSDTLIEVNPSYTHNAVGNHWSPKGISRWYHLKKTLLAQKNGYRCIHLWDWDSVPKFVNSLTAKHTVYPVLPPYIIPKEIATEFIQQYGLYDVTKNIPNILFIGIRYKTKLMSLMGFRQLDPIFNIWELVCIENRFGYSVFGGHQSIMEEFIRQCNPGKIISFADYSKTNGESLEALGFEYKKFIPPTKIWSKGRHAIIDSPTIIPEAMLLEKWLPVYNCGYKMYEKVVRLPEL